jgi:hypothetical protein
LPNWKAVSQAKTASAGTIQVEKDRNHKKRRRHRLADAAVISSFEGGKTLYFCLFITDIRPGLNNGSINLGKFEKI